MKQIRVCAVDELEEEKIYEFELPEKTFCLLKRKENVYAFAAMCPHASVHLCDGWIDPLGRIVCPEHKYRFDPVNGRNTSGEGYKLFTYAVEIQEGFVHIVLL